MSTPVLLLYRIGIILYFGAELIVEGTKPRALLTLLCIRWLQPAIIMLSLALPLTLPAQAASVAAVCNHYSSRSWTTAWLPQCSVRITSVQYASHVWHATAGVHFGHPGYVWISFFTDWTFCLFGFTGVIGTVVTAQRWHRDRSLRRKGGMRVPNGAVAPAPAIVGQPPVVQMNRKAGHSELGKLQSLQPRVCRPP